MNAGYAFLAEKEEMWANMLMEVLKDNGILPAAVPVHGAGMVMRAGVQERLKVYVPCADKAKAEELLQALFSEKEGEPLS